MSRSLWILLLGFALPAVAQYQTPALDGVVNVGEYAHSSGNWSMTWDATYLYVAKTSVSGPTIVYLDVDPQSTPTAGSSADGNPVSYDDGAGALDLPFRADARAHVAGSSSLRTRHGSGGWTNETTSSADIDAVTAGSTREMRIRWAALPGLSGVPSSFRWLGFDLPAAVADPMPAANGTGATSLHYFYEIAQTTDGSATDPFSLRYSTWRVTDNGDGTATPTLRRAVLDVNADTNSLHRFITFGLSGTTINLASNLAPISQPVTIDGTTQTGYAGSPLVVLRGYGTGASGTPSIGLDLTAGPSFVYGLVVQNCREGIRVSTAVTVESSYIGTNAAGTSAEPNYIGIHVNVGSGSLIGCSVFSERNIISGNLSYQVLVENSDTVSITGNCIGTQADCIGSIGGGGGIRIDNTNYNPVLGSNNAVGGTSPGQGNVIGYIGGNAIEVLDGVYVPIRGNSIGVGYDGTTNAANSGAAVSATNVTGLNVGDLNSGSGNVIRNNNGGISISGTSPGFLAVRNSMSANGSFGISGAIQAAPTIVNARVGSDGTLRAKISATSSGTTETIGIDVYEADASTVPQGLIWKGSLGCFAGNSINSQFVTMPGFTPNTTIVMTATAYSNEICTVSGDGTSAFTGKFFLFAALPTSTALAVSRHAVFDGEQVTLTATVAGQVLTSGHVAFFADGSQIGGCDAVAISSVTQQAQCTTSFDHSVMLTAKYLGDDGAHEPSESGAVQLGVVDRAFIFNGNFSDPTRWSDGTVPTNGTSFVIRAACVLDSVPASDTFTEIHIGDGATFGSLTFTTGQTLKGIIVNGSGSGTIIMNTGGTLSVAGLFSTSGMSFTRGSGTVIYAGSGQTFAPLDYNNVTIAGTVTGGGGTATVYGTMNVNGGTFAPAGGTVVLRGAFMSSGTATFSSLAIPFAATATAANGFGVASSMSVDGTFNPAATAVINGAGTLSGIGTIKVTSTSDPSLESQYSLTRDLSALTAEFSGSATQYISSGGTFHRLIINNAAGVDLSAFSDFGTTTVTDTLTLTAGTLRTNGPLAVTNTSFTAVVRIGGWLKATQLLWQLGSGSHTYLFPVGDGTYAPVSVEANGLAAPGNFGVTAVNNPESLAANAGIDPARDSNVLWQVSTSLNSTFVMTFSFGSNVDGSATPANFMLRKLAFPGFAATNIPANPSATSISASISGFHTAALFVVMAGNQKPHHYAVTASGLAAAGVPFATNVVQQDALDVPITTDNSTAVTMSSNSANVQFDANGDGTYGDNTRTLTNGAFSIVTLDNSIDTVTITATDGNSVTGTSATILIASLNVFHGPGNFSDTSKWSFGSLPTGSSQFYILGACNVDVSTGETYGNVRLGSATTAGSLVWPGNTTFSAAVISSSFNGSAIDMTNGGTLSVEGINTANLTFTRGSGTVVYAGSGLTLAALDYNNLTVSGTVTAASGTARVYGLFNVSGTFAPGGGSVEMRGILQNNGPATFHDLLIPVGVNIAAPSSFSVSGTMTVDGTFSPMSTAVISGGTLTGSGTVIVTGTANNSFGSQYTGAKTLENLTVEFAGSTPQAIDRQTYFNLTINNPAGAAPAAGGPFALPTNVSGVLTLSSGVLHATGLFVGNPSSAAVVAGSGWYTGQLIRAVAVGTTTYTFPGGTGSAAAPLTITFHDVSSQTSAALTVLTDQQYGGSTDSGIDPSKDANVYWQLSFSAAASYDVVASHAAHDDAGANPLTFVMRVNQGSWADAPANAAATTVTASGIAATGSSAYFHVGSPLLDHFAVSAPSPQTVGSSFTTSVTAKDLFNYTVTTDDSTVVTMTSSTGHVQFDSNSNGTFGDDTKTLTSGALTITSKATNAESVTISATAASKTGTSGAITVNKAGTTTGLGSSLNPSQAGQSVTFTATLTATGGGTITGTVTFKDGATIIGTGTLSGNVATFTTSSLSVTTHSITAVYGGDGNYNGSTSSTVSQTVNPSSFGPPQLFSATATSTSQISVSWAPVSGATGYEVYRSSLNSAYALAASVTTTSLTESTGLVAGRTYLYKVRTLGSGAPSAFTLPDAATTIVFTDTITSGSPKIKAAHITELRTAVNAMRAAVGLGAATFTDPTLTVHSTRVKRLHITELRSFLDNARSLAGQLALTYTDPTITAQSTKVKAAHVNELRAALQ